MFDSVNFLILCVLFSGDGSVVYLDETMAPSHELSGADCDTVYRVVYAGNEVITSCRDGKIRVYDTS